MIDHIDPQPANASDLLSILLVAHGSRRETSNAEIRQLVEHLRQNHPEFKRIDCAFLELASPSIASGLQQMIKQGAQNIIVLPYFLSAGRHVLEDIPAAVEPLRLSHPQISIRIAEHLGASNGIGDLLVRQIQKLF